MYYLYLPAWHRRLLFWLLYSPIKISSGAVEFLGGVVTLIDLGWIDPFAETSFKVLNGTVGVGVLENPLKDTFFDALLSIMIVDIISKILK